MTLATAASIRSGAEIERLVAVDPGSTTGVATFENGKLQTSTHGNFIKMLKLLRKHATWADHLVIECPRLYPSQRQKADPNAMIVLGRKVGTVEEIFLREGVLIEVICPSDWKGQTSKSISGKRIKKALSEEETKILDKNHNAVDAVGIGLWRFGRYR